MTVPNYADASFAVQAELDSADLEILATAHAQTGVVSGCAVTAQGTPNMTVAVASGTVLVAGTSVAVSSGNVTITAAAVLPRFDLIVVNSSGTKSAVAGTAAAQPVFPAIPASSVVLAAVYVPGGDTAIGSTQIVDKRVFVVDLNGTYVPQGGVKFVDLYGAVGDGVTDDTAAIHAAASAAGDKGVLVFGAKTYAHGGLTFNQDGLTLRGQGRGKTKLQSLAGTTADAVKINTSASTFRGPFTIEQMDVLGVSGSGIGLNVRYGSLLSLRDVRFNNHGSDGVRTFEITSIAAVMVECRDNGGNGWSGGQKNDACSFIACDFFSNDGYGCVLNYLGTGGARNNGVSFNGCAFTQNTLGGWWVRGASTNGVKFMGCYHEANLVQHGLIGETGVAPSPVAVDSCYFNGSSSTPIAVNVVEGSALKFADCLVENMTSGAINLQSASCALTVERSDNASGYGVTGPNGTTYAIDNGRTIFFSGGGVGPQFIASGTGIVPLNVRAITSQTSSLIQALAANGSTVMSKMRADGTIQIGSATPGGTADLNVVRNDTQGALARIEQQGAGTAASAIFNALADGTSTSAYAAFFRSKGTGSIAKFNNASVTVLDVLVSGRLQLNAGPQVVTGTGSPESVVTAGIGSIFLRTDGGAATTLYVKESGAGNTGWVGK